MRKIPGRSDDREQGFTLHPCGPDEPFNRIALFIPDRLHEILSAEKERQLREQELERQRSATENGARQADPSAKGLAAASKTYQERQKEEADLKERDDALAQEMLWKEHAAAASRLGRGAHKYAVFEPKQALGLYRLTRRYHKDERSRFERVYEQLCATGHMRTIAKPCAAALQHLAATQPHMAAIVEFVQDHVALAKHSRRPLRIPPMLLVGEAGVGKTHFAQALASALRAPISIQRLDTDITTSVMLGSDRKWGNSQHGLVFELLALGPAANPVVVLDEIDKVNRVDQRVQASLYSLLEPVSARQVRDISLDFELDASQVTWIATANEANGLDAPLRSRFREFHIPVPTAAQCLVLASEVIRATIRDTAVRGFSEGTGRLERDLAHLSARQIQQITREAIARALKAGRMQLAREDLPAWVAGHPEGAVGQCLH